MKRQLGHIIAETVLEPQGTASAAVGARISMANYDSCVFVIMGADALGAAAVSFEQWKASSGGTALALVPRRGYVKDTAATPDQGDAYVDTAPATNDTIDDSFGLTASQGQLIMVEFTADELDVDGGYDFISAKVSPGAATKLVSIVAILGGARYAVAPDLAPTT